MKLSLINDLNESKQYRSRHAFSRVTARQVADHAFMDMIALWILYNEFEYAPRAMAYASSTGQLNSFSRYIQSGTDLYLNLHVVSQKRTDLLDTTADQVALDRFNVNEKQVVRYLKQMSSNSINGGHVRMTLQRLEQSLQIENSNYRSVRRLAQSWPTLDTNRKRTVLTRILQFYKAQARRSEMFVLLQSLATSKNLVDANAKNAELSPAAKAAAVAGTGYVGYQFGRKLGKALM
jgi:hypothetical protein